MIKNKKITLYLLLLILSIILFSAMWFLNIDGAIGFIMCLSSIYLFVGSIIKLCKTSEKFKNSVLSFLDLLFWLP